MEPRRIGIEEARGRLGDIVSAAQHDRAATIISRNGRDVAAVVPLDRAPIWDSPGTSRYTQLKRRHDDLDSQIRLRVRDLARLLVPAAREYMDDPAFAALPHGERLWVFLAETDAHPHGDLSAVEIGTVAQQIIQLAGLGELTELVRENSVDELPAGLLARWVARFPAQLAESLGYVHP